MLKLHWDQCITWLTWTKTVMGEWKHKGCETAALTLVRAVAIKEISLNTMRKKLENKTEDS